MTYEQYMIKLIDETGARNYYEAWFINRLREHLPHRHRWTTTSIGKSYQFGKYWVKEIIKELRSYRNWLDWCEKYGVQPPATREAINQPIQLELFGV